MISFFQLRKYGDIDIFVTRAELVHQHHHDPPPSDHTAVGRIAASTTYFARTTAGLCSTWYSCYCLMLLYHMNKAEIVRFIALLNLNQPHHDPSTHLASDHTLHDDRDAATLRYRPASRAQ